MVLMLSIIFYMSKYSLLIGMLSIFVGGHVFAQENTAKDEAKKDKQETVQETVNRDDKPAAEIKVVPSARNKNAKPAKVNSARQRSAGPGGTRPARNVRPSSRPVRPGNGRN